MKILHTADWHLGRSLYGQSRYEEFSKFLDWLNSTIKKEGIDVLLIAGDIFDTPTPSNKAQALYYQFLCKAANSDCRHIVIIGGNHDSPSFLNAPKELLKTLNVYVVGAAPELSNDEVITLKDNKNDPEAIICAVPYLRDKDIRTAEPGETIEDKNTKLIKGIKDHYSRVCSIAEEKKLEFKKAGFNIPIIGMGHLFTAGGKTTEGDGVRDLYVGSLAHVGGEIFPTSINYLALGHLHVPQKVGGINHFRYSGSPIPMGFGEANQTKKVIVVEFKDSIPQIQEINIPSFQNLEKLTGILPDIEDKIKILRDEKKDIWLEIEYTSQEIVTNLKQILEELVTGSKVRLIRIKNKQFMDRVINTIQKEEALESLDVNSVFDRYLDTYEIANEEREKLKYSYNEIVKSIYESDINAE